MSDGTHIKRRGPRWISSARPGASEVAPTAPHGTEGPAGVGVAGKPSGPSRFWDPARVRRALYVALGLSVALHYWLAPWTLMPKASGIEFKDVDAELTIPTDLLGEEAPEAPKAPEPPAPTPVPTAEGPGGLDASAPKPKDASVDAAKPKPDAAPLAALDLEAGVRPESDAAGTSTDLDAAVTDADVGDAAPDAAQPVAAGTAVPGGLASLVQGGTVMVDLFLNIDVIRAHPVGARSGPLFTGIPQWNDFVQGGKTNFDPLQHTNWIHIYGPSLIHTGKDAVHIHYSAPDALVDHAMDVLAERTDKGGAFDAGVPGIKAVLGFADNAPRAMLRVRPNEMVIVPPEKAREFALVLKQRAIRPDMRPGEALRLKVREPSRQISIPKLKFPQSLKELRLWVVPRNGDGGADVYAEGDCEDEAAALDVRDALRALVEDQKQSAAVRLITRGLLNNVQIDASGKQVVLKANATREQIEAIVGAVAFQLGVQIPPSKPE